MVKIINTCVSLFSNNNQSNNKGSDDDGQTDGYNSDKSSKNST